MAYLFDRRFNTPDMWRGVLMRNLELLWREAHKFFMRGETVTHRFDPDMLGVWIGVGGTSRPVQLLRRIKDEAFRTFAFGDVKFDGTHYYWVHFRAM